MEYGRNGGAKTTKLFWAIANYLLCHSIINLHAPTIQAKLFPRTVHLIRYIPPRYFPIRSRVMEAELKEYKLQVSFPIPCPSPLHRFIH